MEDTTLAYLAGIIDADGTIGIKRSTYNIRVTGDAKVPSYQERIAMSQVASDVPQMLKDAFGGRVGLHKGYARNARDGLRWEATNRQAATAIRALLPYLRIKRSQAEAVLLLRADKERPRSETRSPTGTVTSMIYGGRSLKWQGKRIDMPRWGLSAETAAYRQSLFEQVKALNHHGLDPLAYPARKPRLI